MRHASEHVGVDIKRWIEESLRLIKLDEDSIRRTAADEEATLAGFAVVLVAGVAQGVGGVVGFHGFNPFSLAAILLVPILFYVLTGIHWGLARLFGGTATFVEQMRPFGVSQTIYWITVVPFIGPFIAILAGIWDIVVMVVIIRVVHGLSTEKAVAVVLIPILICCCGAVAIGAALGGLAALIGVAAVAS